MKYALKLSKCFYEISGKNFISCDFDQDLQTCSKKLEKEEWTTYLSFYNHVDNLCFYYKGLIWQEQSEKMIESLVESAYTSRDLL